MARLDRQAGLTLIEVMIAIAIMVVMMFLAWTTISHTAKAKSEFEAREERNQELRVSMGRVVADLESAYLSLNEDQQSLNRRTLFVDKGGGKVPGLRFSSLGHQVYWADANESEQTAISYEAMTDREHPEWTDWARREQRRLSELSPSEEPSDLDILAHDIESVKFEYWDWKDKEWQDRWDSTAVDGERNRLPGLVRITLTVKDKGGEDYKLTTEARILLQEPLNFVQ